VKTIAQQSMTQKERNAFGLSLRAVVLSRVAGMCAVTVSLISAIKRHLSRVNKPVSGFIGSNWKRGTSIRGASPLVANG
jgi:hypothetical protein